MTETFEGFCRARGLTPMVYGADEGRPVLLAAKDTRPWEGRYPRPAGPWDDEPDYATWTTASGLPGLVVRNRLGALCGYAGVPAGHPYYDARYNAVPVDVHGGLTYGNRCAGHVCHPHAGPDPTYWLGFDCAHSGDVIPAIDMSDRGHLVEPWPTAYRDFDYVRSQVESLAAQLAGAALPGVEPVGDIPAGDAGDGGGGEP